MRDQLDHLPEIKQRELADVVRILFEEFDAATRTGNQPFTKQARIFKLVLYAPMRVAIGSTIRLAATHPTMTY